MQLTTLYGGVNGAKTDGRPARIRRVRDRQYPGARQRPPAQRHRHGAGVDLSTIPLNSIERIEITRGNSGAVLYGDNAVGGVINIVTKNGVGGPPVAMRGRGRRRLVQPAHGVGLGRANSGPWSTSFYGNAIKSDGYRDNNALDQRNGVGNLNYTTPDLTAFLTVTGDDQKLRLPGGRIVDPSIGVNELVTDRRGTDTPFDYGNQQGANATAGFTKTLWNGADLIVDGGVRNKKHAGALLRHGTVARRFQLLLDLCRCDICRPGRSPRG